MKKRRKLIRNEKGSVLIIVSMCILSMVGITATALDYSRGSLLRSELVASLDAAALAGGTVANSPTLNATVNKYFKANMPTGYMSAKVDPLVITQPNDKSTLTVSTSAHMKDAMMQVVGWNMTNVAASSQVTIEKKGMEIVLVLDNTGSMADTAGGGVTKINALKTASNTLIGILYGSRTTVDNLWIGLVPFSQAVNVGNTRGADWVSGTGNYGTTGWSGCVEARDASGRDITDDPPSVALFPKYYSACLPMTGSYQTWWNAWYGTNTGTTPPARTNCTIVNNSPVYRTGISTTTYGPNQYCPQALTQMTANKTNLLAAITTMQATGDTEINMGLVWGWRMLSPRWRVKVDGVTSIWGGEMAGNATSNPPKPKLPLNYRTPLMNKIVVLLTDGDNTMQTNNYNSYGQLSAGRVGSTTTSGAATKLDTKTSSVCTAMKAQGITIYTVALGTAISANGKTLLKNCATLPQYYFESPTGSDLQTAFTTIGDSLSNLRISK